MYEIFLVCVVLLLISCPCIWENQIHLHKWEQRSLLLGATHRKGQILIALVSVPSKTGSCSGKKDPGSCQGGKGPSFLQAFSEPLIYHDELDESPAATEFPHGGEFGHMIIVL